MSLLCLEEGLIRGVIQGVYYKAEYTDFFERVCYSHPDKVAYGFKVTYIEKRKYNT